jgi:hypothetical protein
VAWPWEKTKLIGDLVEDEANALFEVENTLLVVETAAAALGENNFQGEQQKNALSSFVCSSARNLANRIREISETMECLGLSVRRIEKGFAAEENRLSPVECARLVETISGAKPILNEDLNALTYRLRACAEANPGMSVFRDAWEKAITPEGAKTICESMNGFRIQFDRMEMRVEG